MNLNTVMSEQVYEIPFNPTEIYKNDIRTWL